MSRYITPEEAPDSAAQSEDEEALRLLKKLDLAELRKFMEFLHFIRGRSDAGESCNEIITIWRAREKNVMTDLEVSDGR